VAARAGSAWLVAWLLVSACATALAQPARPAAARARAAAPVAAPASAASAPASKASAPSRPAPHVAALGRLEDQLRSHLRARGSWVPMPWREAMVSPDATKLVWHPRAVTWRFGKMDYRPAFDPAHRWYYVLRLERNGPAEYYGPLEEQPGGGFMEWRGAGRP
jgi:hypothetical protein